jgi:hypothetical protein
LARGSDIVEPLLPGRGLTRNTTGSVDALALICRPSAAEGQAERIFGHGPPFQPAGWREIWFAGFELRGGWVLMGWAVSQMVANSDMPELIGGADPAEDTAFVRIV